jgi:hypothetical protein
VTVSRTISTVLFCALALGAFFTQACGEVAPPRSFGTFGGLVGDASADGPDELSSLPSPLPTVEPALVSPDPYAETPVDPGRVFPEDVACIDLKKAYATLTLAPNVEGLVYYSAFNNDPKVNSVQTVGEPCSKAQDRTKCEKRLAYRTHPLRFWHDGWDTREEPSQQPSDGSVGFAIQTIGDELIEVRSIDALRPLLTSIDSLQKAQAWAVLHRKGANCGGSPNARTNEDSFDLYAKHVFCETSEVLVFRERLIRVHLDGRIETIFDQEYGRKPRQCCNSSCGQ